MAEPSISFTAETVFAPLIRLLERIGLPESVRFDRDPRFMGSAGMRDFPTPFVRFWYALGIRPIVNPPQSPEQNAYVERLHGTVEREYVAQQRPDPWKRHGRPCRTFNSMTTRCGPIREQPAAIAPTRGASCPARTPALPEEVNPDCWLEAYDGRTLARRVKPSGTIELDGKRYYVSSKYAGQQVVAQIQAAGPAVLIWSQHTLVRTYALKGVIGHAMPLIAFVAWCEQEARTVWRRYEQRRAMARMA